MINLLCNCLRCPISDAPDPTIEEVQVMYENTKGKSSPIPIKPIDKSINVTFREMMKEKK